MQDAWPAWQWSGPQPSHSGENNAGEARGQGRQEWPTNGFKSVARQPPAEAPFGLHWLSGRAVYPRAGMGRAIRQPPALYSEFGGVDGRAANVEGCLMADGSGVVSCGALPSETYRDQSVAAPTTECGPLVGDCPRPSAVSAPWDIDDSQQPAEARGAYARPLEPSEPSAMSIIAPRGLLRARPPAART
jgi:hypothetical protein